jgi:DNA repair protein RecO (recombination protein O)
MGDRLSLAGLNAVTGLLSLTLPERDPHPDLYRRTVALLDLLDQTDLWPLAYLQWELALLDDMGFGLDLTQCAVTGVTDGLIYVSPKTARAVSAEGAGEWADRMLALPPVLLGQGDASQSEITVALATTGYFIENRLLKGAGDKPMPASRARLIEAMNR